MKNNWQSFALLALMSRPTGLFEAPTSEHRPVCVCALGSAWDVLQPTHELEASTPDVSSPTNVNNRLGKVSDQKFSARRVPCWELKGGKYGSRSAGSSRVDDATAGERAPPVVSDATPRPPLRRVYRGHTALTRGEKNGYGLVGALAVPSFSAV